jgi:histidinol dehydrogenase
MRVERRQWDGEAPYALAAEIRARTAPDTAISAEVAELVESVRSGGEARLMELIRELDGVELRHPVVAPEAIPAALGTIDDELRIALEAAAENIRRVAEAQVGPGPIEVTPPQAQRIRIAEVPVRSAGIYAPGGRAPYPSSVLMGAIPARAAGVDRVVVASPPGPDGSPHPAVLAACAVAGVQEVYAMGGAHAVAALAYGNERVRAVDVIAGPGGPWVQEAKLAVSRQVGIDGYAGPSELAVIFDSTVPAEWIALDLCAQAEHGDDAPLVAISADGRALDELERLLPALAAERPSVSDALVLCVEAPDVRAALALCNELAPEHLELACSGANGLAGMIRTAGCVFVGPEGATAFGDYAAGSNHVLPTGGAGRFQSPLSPATFRRKIGVVEMNPASAGELAGVVETIAAAEGFVVHGESARARADGPPGDR